MRKKPKLSLFRFLMTFPAILYCLGLILLPILYIFFLSFLTSDSYGGFTYDFTLNNYAEIFDPTYILMFLKSSGIALVVTFLALLISYPFAIFLMDKSEKSQNLLIKLVMIPFLTNSLIRTYGWIILLRKNGLINSALLSTGLISAPLSLMYNTLGIIIGMTYTLLPFMILPLFNTLSKIDVNVINAARDLGANGFQTFKRIIFPLSIPGIISGITMVFVPSLTTFVISKILGGSQILLIGNIVEQEFTVASNWNLGSGLSIVLMVFIIFNMILSMMFDKDGEANAL